MNVTIIGTGFVGVVSSAVFASFGNTVVGLDIDPKRIESLKKGKVPFYEPGLEDLLVKTQETGNLTFTDSYEEAIKEADVIMIAVGTPSAPDGQADLKFVFAASESLAQFLKEDAIVVVKSTVPPGTCDRVREKIEAKQQANNFYVVSLPEFLREGSAVDDTLHPDRVILGANEPKAIEILSELHAPFKAPIIVMKPESAQMCKYASNAYLATRITFINQIANLCEVNGANILEVIKGIGLDERIGGHYWYPGLGYGGSCFPKDVKELAAYAKAVGHTDNLMVTISNLNEARIAKLMRQFEEKVGGWKGKKVAVLGLSFKPNTDDMREAPSLKVIPTLLDSGAVVRAFDPMSQDVARSVFASMDWVEGDMFRIVNSIDDAVREADVVMVLVEWKEFISLSPSVLLSKANPGAFLIDTRDQYDAQAVQKAGMKYIGIGIQ